MIDDDRPDSETEVENPYMYFFGTLNVGNSPAPLKLSLDTDTASSTPKRHNRIVSSPTTHSYKIGVRFLAGCFALVGRTTAAMQPRQGVYPGRGSNLEKNTQPNRYERVVGTRCSFLPSTGNSTASVSRPFSFGLMSLRWVAIIILDKQYSWKTILFLHNLPGTSSLHYKMYLSPSDAAAAATTSGA